MTAGRGIVHSEMPQITKGDLHGFQLWINLPKKDKMIKPRYQDYQASDIPTVDNGERANVRVMAGSFQDTAGALSSHCGSGACVSLPVRSGHAGMASVRRLYVPGRSIAWASHAHSDDLPLERSSTAHGRL